MLDNEFYNDLSKLILILNLKHNILFNGNIILLHQYYSRPTKLL